MLMCLVVLMASMFQLNQIQLGNHKNWIAVNRERDKNFYVKFKKKRMKKWSPNHLKEEEKKHHKRCLNIS